MTWSNLCCSSIDVSKNHTLDAVLRIPSQYSARSPIESRDKTNCKNSEKLAFKSNCDMSLQSSSINDILPKLNCNLDSMNFRSRKSSSLKPDSFICPTALLKNNLNTLASIIVGNLPTQTESTTNAVLVHSTDLFRELQLKAKNRGLTFFFLVRRCGDDTTTTSSALEVLADLLRTKIVNRELTSTVLDLFTDLLHERNTFRFTAPMRSKDPLRIWKSRSSAIFRSRLAGVGSCGGMAPSPASSDTMLECECSEQMKMEELSSDWKMVNYIDLNE
nr:hypothetical protein Iba_chr09eCG12000 [Ipomoea batatas]